MRLTRCKDQPSQSLDECYSKLSQSLEPATREGGKAILDLLQRLRALPEDWIVYGLTSHYRLCLLAEDDYRSPWFVIVAALDRRNYYVEYLMPEADAPWSQAYVRGEAKSEDDAVNMIVTAMKNSEGWSTRV